MLTNKECKEAAEEYLEWQKKYNDTGDTEILWFKMRPWIIETSKSIFKKLAAKAYKPVLYLEEKSEEVADSIVGRYIKNIKYSKELPITMVYWAVVGVAYSDSSKNLDCEKKVEALIKEQIYDELYR